MARHSAIDDHLNTVAGPPGRAVSDAGVSAARLRDVPDTGPDAALVLARAQLLRGDPSTVLAAARQLSDLLPGQPDPVDMLVDVALAHGQAQIARTILAQAEATAPALQIAALKARIAMSEGDFPAAKAILVTAIEASPEVVALRTLLAEVMVAAGTASDARAVLTHLGQPPVNPPLAAAEDDVDHTTCPEQRLG